jgi:hypothetical protein
MTEQKTKERIEALEYENAMLRKKIKDMRDVLRFCAMSNVGTYYQQQSAREMLLNNTKLVWDRNNEDGTYNEDYKKWIFQCGGQEALDAVLAEEKELLGGQQHE